MKLHNGLIFLAFLVGSSVMAAEVPAEKAVEAAKLSIQKADSFAVQKTEVATKKATIATKEAAQKAEEAA